MYQELFNINSKLLVKYSLLAMILYSFLRLIPKYELSNKQYIVIILIILTTFYIFNCLDLKEYMTVSEEEAEKLRNQIDTEVQEEKEKLMKEVEKETRCLNLKNAYNETKEELDSIRKEIKSLTKIDANPENTKKYYEMLKQELLIKNIIDELDAENYDAKLESGFAYRDVINKLEMLKAQGNILKSVNDFRYSEIPRKAYEPLGKGISEWDEGSEMTQLKTDKWKPVEIKPKECYKTAPCDTCSVTHSSVGATVRTRDWDLSRKVTNFNINKEWAMNN